MNTAVEGNSWNTQPYSSRYTSYSIVEDNMTENVSEVPFRDRDSSSRGLVMLWIKHMHSTMPSQLQACYKQYIDMRYNCRVINGFAYGVG